MRGLALSLVGGLALAVAMTTGTFIPTQPQPVQSVHIPCNTQHPRCDLPTDGKWSLPDVQLPTK